MGDAKKNKSANRKTSQDSSRSHISLEQQQASDSQATMKQSRPPFEAEQISFLCPNGHKLSGPISLQGRPGLCPKCKTKFLIPDYESVPSSPSIISREDLDEAVAKSASQKIPLENEEPVDSGSQQEASGIAIGPPPVPTPEPEAEIIDIDPQEIEEINDEDIGSIESNSFVQIDAEAAVALPELFKLLWHEQMQEGVLELHLEGGITLSPDWWARDLSNQGYGLFALQNRDGTYSMEVIAWKDILRISLRNVTELPSGWFS